MESTNRLNESLCDSCITSHCIFQAGITRNRCDFYKTGGTKVKELEAMDEHTQEALQQLLSVLNESIQAVAKKADEAKRTFNETIAPALESIRSIGSAVEETSDLPRPPVEIKKDIKHEKNL